MAQPTHPVITCLDCSGVFSRLAIKGPRPKRCQPCTDAAKRRRIRSWAGYDTRPSEVPCADCGVVLPLPAMGPRKIRCTPCAAAKMKQQMAASSFRLKRGRYEALDHRCRTCGVEVVRRVVNGPFPEFCPPCKKARRRAQHDALKTGRRMVIAAAVEVVDREVVFAECRWVCGICSERVDPLLAFPHPRAASLDHIVPLAKGGAHTRANTQLAHYDCNSRKNASLPPSTRPEDRQALGPGLSSPAIR